MTGRGNSLRSVDLDAGEGRGVAATARLEGFELVEVFEKHAVEVRLVALNVFDGTGGEDTVEPGISAVETATESSELVEVPLGGPEGVALEADEAIEAPERKGDAVGEDEFKVSDGLEIGDLASEMVIPIGLILDFGDDRVGGEDAVTKGVGRGRKLCLGRPAAGTASGNKGSTG